MNLIYLSSFIAIIVSVFFIYRYSPFKVKKKQHSNALFTEALNAMVKGDRIGAINLLKQVVKQDSDHISAYLQLGNIIKDDNPLQAIKIHQSLTVRPNLPTDIKIDIHRALASDYYSVSQYKKAKEEAKQILKLEKRNLWAVEFLISLAEENKEWDDAASWTKQMHRITGKKQNEDVAKFEVYKGLDCLKNSQIEEAKNFFNKAVKLAPEFSLSYHYLGDVYAKTRDLVKAVENWENFAGLDSENGKEVYTKIETALFDLGRYSEVENFYLKIIKMNPSNFEAILRLANVLEEKGEGVSAMNLLEDAISSKGKDIRADLMKLKLSLSTSTPIELGHQLDKIIEKLS